MASVRPKETLRGMELDMRVSPNTGLELRDEIIDCVAATQAFVLAPLPNWLILSHKQFVSMTDYTQEMHNTKDRMMVTPLNVMEVEVDEDLDPVQFLLEDGVGANWDKKGSDGRAD